MYLKGPLYIGNCNFSCEVLSPTAIGFSSYNGIGVQYYSTFGIQNPSGGYGPSASPLLNKWTYVSVVFNGIASGSSVYINGVASSSGSPVALSPSSSELIMGQGYYTCCAGLAAVTFNGTIADLQIYNTTLSANEILAMYQEGIGGVPINLQNLVGWWPLNGNANDYSGNLNNGVATNVVFTSSWTSGYSAP